MAPLIALALKAVASGAISEVVPEVVRALGGDKAAEAAETVMDAVHAATGEPDPEKAVDALAADPAKQLELQHLLSDERREFARMALEETKAYLGDTQGARDRDAKLRELGYRNFRANFMLAMAGLLVVIILAIIVAVSPLDDFVKSTLLLILGRALGYVDQGFNFEFGTTRSSSKKDETIQQMAGK